MAQLTIEQLKAAYKAGKRIQVFTDYQQWENGTHFLWSLPAERYRIHPDDVEYKPTPHPHAILMLEYAKEAAVDSECWKNWEFRGASSEWQSHTTHPEWYSNNQYRRKIKTIRIGDRDVPAPLTESDAIPDIIYVARPSAKRLYICIHKTHSISTDIPRRLVHSSKENAIAHAEALIAISGGNV